MVVVGVICGYFVYWTQMTWNKRTQNHETIPSGFSLNRKQTSLLFYIMCVQYTKFWLKFWIWNPLISGQIVNSFGQGKCTFDCQSRNLKNYASGAHVSTSPCMLRTEILITVNISCIWTFHTNSLLHEYLFLMHVHNYMQLTINTFINDSVSFTGIIQS